MLDLEFKYFLEHQEELAEQYAGKFVVIKGDEVIGSYATEIEAYREGQKKAELGTFLIQKCEVGKESYSQTFHSRVVFA